MKHLLFAASLVVSGCIGDVEDTSAEASDIRTDLSRNNLQFPMRIKSTINTSGAGMCMDVAGGYTSTGTPIVQYPCHGGVNQQFYLYQFDSVPTVQIRTRLDPRKCVGVRDGQLALSDCDGASGFPTDVTKFRLEGSDLNAWPTSHVRFHAVLQASTCIDIPGGYPDHSLILQIYNCHNGPNQLWEVTNL